MPSKFVHVNLVAQDWKRLASFYQDVFDCIPVPPERNLSGEWLDQATGLEDTKISGIHLRLPGYGEEGPTLEIFQYDTVPDHLSVRPNSPGFSHIAFSVNDVQETAARIFELGGSPIGKFTVRQIAGVGTVTFQYCADPEGNIIEVQSWDKGS